MTARTEPVPAGYFIAPTIFAAVVLIGALICTRNLLGSQNARRDITMLWMGVAIAVAAVSLAQWYGYVNAWGLYRNTRTR